VAAAQRVAVSIGRVSGTLTKSQISVGANIWRRGGDFRKQDANFRGVGHLRHRSVFEGEGRMEIVAPMPNIGISGSSKNGAVTGQIPASIGARSDAVTFGSVKLHASVRMHVVPYTGSMATTDGPTSEDWNDHRSARPFIEPGKPRVALRFIDSPRNLGLTGPERGADC
jgi:hypothetical protein